MTEARLTEIERRAAPSPNGIYAADQKTLDLCAALRKAVALLRESIEDCGFGEHLDSDCWVCHTKMFLSDYDAGGKE